MINLTFDKILQLPSVPFKHYELLPNFAGLYFVVAYTPQPQLLYLGKTKNSFSERWKYHHRRPELAILHKLGIAVDIAWLELRVTDSILLEWEGQLKVSLRPLMNDTLVLCRQEERSNRFASTSWVEPICTSGFVPDALITAIDGADTNSNMVDDDDITDSDWEYFCLIRTGRSGEVIDGRKTRKSKTKLCQEIFGITSDGGNSMKRAMEEYDRIRDSFVVPWIRELLVAQTPKWEIIEEIWSVSRANQPNKVLEDLQRLIEFLQKYEGTPFVASQFRLLSELREECGEDYIRRWYEVERCFMLEDIAPEDIQAIAIRAYLDQVNWEFVTGYIVTALGQITQIQEAA